MATQTLQLVVQVNGASQAAASVKQIGDATAGVRDALAFMRNALVALSFARAFEGLLEAVSSFQQINNQLRVITSSTEEAAQAQNTVKQLSIETRQSYQETALVFASIARGTSSMGLNWGQITNLTKAFNESLAISGATTQQARNSMRDFIELLNLGVVQGRNFRALLMQDPALVNAVATTITATGVHAKEVNEQLDKIRGTGKNISGGGLFELSKSFPGAFTSGDMVKAIESQKLLAEQWKNTKETVGQAIEILKTQFIDFVGRMAEWATGATGVAQAINTIGDHLPQILAVVGAFLALVALNAGLSALAGIFGTLVTVFSSLTSGFVALFNVARNFFLLITSEAGILVLPFLLLATVVGVVLYKAFNDLAQSMGGWGELALKIITIIGAEFVEAFEHPMTTFKAFLGVVLEGINAMLSGISQMLNYGIDIANKFNPFGQMSHVDLTFKNPLSDAMDKFTSDVKTNANSGEAAIKSAYGKFTNFGAPGTGLDMNGHPNVGSTSDVEAAKKNSAAAESALDKLIAKYEPAAAAASRYADNVKIFTNAEKVGINVSAELAKWGLTKEELMKREERAAIGAGNAETDYTGRIKELNTALQAGNITQAESNRLADEALVKRMAARFDISAGVTGAEAKERLLLTNEQAMAQTAVTKAFGNTNALKEYEVAQVALNQAVKDGVVSQRDATKELETYQLNVLKTRDDVQSGIDIAMIKFNQTMRDQNTIAEKAVSSALSEANANNTFAVSLDALNKLHDQGVISNEKYVQSVQDIELALLKTKTDALSGFEEGMITVQKNMANAATDASKVVVDAFDNMTNAITNFFVTGKINIQSFVTGMLTDLDRLAVKQAIMAPLANALGLGSGQNIGSGGGPLTGFLSTIMGGGAAGSNLTSNGLGSSATNPVWTQSADLASAGLTGTDIFNTATGGIPSSVPITSSAFGFSGSSGGGLFGSLFGGSSTGSSGGGLFSGIGKLLGFAGGADFQVGGLGGVDSQVVAFRASPDEHISVKTPAQMRDEQNKSGASINLGGLHLHGVQDADSFMRSRGQAMSGINRLITRAATRNAIMRS
jgi:tape measure domain-containing protein